MDYSAFSREELIQRIRELEGSTGEQAPEEQGTGSQEQWFDPKEFGEMFGQFLGMDFSNMYNDYIGVMINNLTVPVYYTDLEGSIQGCNASFEALMNRAADSMKNRHFTEVFTEASSAQAHGVDEQLLDSRNMINYETAITDSGGSVKEVVISKSIIKNLDGSVAGIIGVINDITEKRTAERALVESEQKLRVANAMKDKFFSIISHDLKSPFSAILGISEILHDSYDELSDEDHKTFVSDLKNSAQKVFKLVENLLAWARSQRGEMQIRPEEVSLAALIDEMIELYTPLAKQRAITILSSVSPETHVAADKDMLSIVFRNLMNNAVKFNKDGGEVAVSAETEGRFAAITIRDVGIGIASEDFDKLFRIDSPRTIGHSPYKGSGLGLILCKEYLDKMGGDIRVNSELGSYTEFVVRLPLS